MAACWVAALIGYLLCLAGPIVCLAVPEEANARGYLIGSVILQIINFGHSVLLYLLPKFKIAALDTASDIAGGVSALLFLLFLKSLAGYIGRADLARRAVNVMIVSAVLLALAGGMYAGMNAGNAAFGLLLVAISVGLIIAFVMYVNLINDLRKCLRR
jgi:hypothetical protein